MAGVAVVEGTSVMSSRSQSLNMEKILEKVWIITGKGVNGAIIQLVYLE